MSLMNLQVQTLAGARREGMFFRKPITPLNIPNVNDLVLGKVVATASQQCWTRLAARPATMKTQRQGTQACLAFRLDEEEATRW